MPIVGKETCGSWQAVAARRQSQRAQSSRALRPRPLVFCISATRAPRCFRGFMPAIMGGKSLLRIEDTDKARSTKEAIDVILDGLDWLGLEFDGQTYYQSQFEARHCRSRQRIARQRRSLSLLPDTGRTCRSPREGPRRAQAVPYRQRMARCRSLGLAREPGLRRADQGPTRRRDKRSTISSRATSRSRMRKSTISSCCVRTARRPTCSRWWSTITTWA